MYVICVQKKSETFENIFCKSIKAGQEDCFLIGVVLDEYMIYMPKMKNNVQDMQCTGYAISGNENSIYGNIKIYSIR